MLLLPLWAAAVAWLLAKILREPGGWRALYGVSELGIGLHIAGDWITSFGTMMIAPFSDWRAGIGTTFIIDLWFSGIIAAGLVLSAVFYRSKGPSLAAAAMLVAYVGFQFVQKQQAIDFGTQSAQSRGLAGAGVTAHPRPVSPFNWTVFVSDPRQVHYVHVNLRRETPLEYRAGDGFVARLDAAYRPLALARWETRNRPGANAMAAEAWNSPPLAFFRWFAEQPADGGASVSPECAWFVDLRFLTPGRDLVPFRFGACRDSPAAPWRAFERDAEGGRIALD